MAPLVPSLLGSLTRQLYAFVRCLPPPGATRCIPTLAAAVHSRGTIAPARFLFTPIRSPLLGQIPHLAALQPSAGMKTRTALKKRCKDCFFVRRRGRLFVFCKSHPRHKQRQG